MDVRRVDTGIAIYSLQLVLDIRSEDPMSISARRLQVGDLELLSVLGNRAVGGRCGTNRLLVVWAWLRWGK